MEDAGYDAIKMETVGKGEKCVDISLAVDMLHYATIPGAMDVCILLTGDKDFIPACLRIRQKGVQMAIVSMKRGCNRALDTTPQMKDFDIIFLDQSISSLIVPKKTMSKRGSSISALEIIKIIYGYLLGEEGTVRSRLHELKAFDFSYEIFKLYLKGSLRFRRKTFSKDRISGSRSLPQIVPGWTIKCSY